MSLAPPHPTRTSSRSPYNASPRPSSPTPSELEENDTTEFGLMSLMKAPGQKTSPWTLVLLGVLILIFILIFALKDKIVDAINPVKQDILNLKGGWLIPIAIMVIISFPPLFGHEIVAIMVGVIWGIWHGFLIVAAGTLLGEIANFLIFRAFCIARGKEYERRRLPYACLARVIREGGFKVILVIRFSAIPPHFSTTIFSVTGVNFLTFVAAAVLALPKQFITVYLGVSATKSNQSKGSKVLSIAVIIIGIGITVQSARWVFWEMERVRGSVIAERRALRQFKAAASASTSSGGRPIELTENHAPPPRGRRLQERVPQGQGFREQRTGYNQLYDRAPPSYPPPREMPHSAPARYVPPARYEF